MATDSAPRGPTWVCSTCGEALELMYWSENYKDWIHVTLAEDVVGWCGTCGKFEQYPKRAVPVLPPSKTYCALCNFDNLQTRYLNELNKKFVTEQEAAALKDDRFIQRLLWCPRCKCYPTTRVVFAPKKNPEKIKLSREFYFTGYFSTVSRQWETRRSNGVASSLNDTPKEAPKPAPIPSVPSEKPTTVASANQTSVLEQLAQLQKIVLKLTDSLEETNKLYATSCQRHYRLIQKYAALERRMQEMSKQITQLLQAPKAMEAVKSP